MGKIGEYAPKKDGTFSNLKKQNYQQSDIDYIHCGDLLNQCVGAHYSVRDFDIPFLGLYGAVFNYELRVCQ